MKLRKINVTGILPILVFEDGADGDLAIWNHVCDGTSCLADRFDTSIKFLLEAHGITAVEINDHTTTTEMVEERGCELCQFMVVERTHDSDLLIGCQRDMKLEILKIDCTGLNDENEVLTQINFMTKDRATPCQDFKRVHRVPVLR